MWKKVRPKMQRGDDEWERRFVLIVSPAIIFVCRFAAAAAPRCYARHFTAAYFSQSATALCKPVRIITMKAVERRPCAAAVIITPIQSHFSNNASDFELLGVRVQSATSCAAGCCLSSSQYMPGLHFILLFMTR